MGPSPPPTGQSPHSQHILHVSGSLLFTISRALAAWLKKSKICDIGVARICCYAYENEINIFSDFSFCLCGLAQIIRLFNSCV
jgi:hypothetical protein